MIVVDNFLSSSRGGLKPDLVEHLLRKSTKMVNLTSRSTKTIDLNLVNLKCSVFSWNEAGFSEFSRFAAVQTEPKTELIPPDPECKEMSNYQQSKLRVVLVQRLDHDQTGIRSGQGGRAGARW